MGFLQRVMYSSLLIMVSIAGNDISYYLSIAEQLPRIYEEIPLASLTVSHVEPLWEQWERSQIASISSVYHSGLPKIDGAMVMRRLASWAKENKDRTPQLRSYEYQTVSVAPGENVFIIGSLGGSYHSLVQILHELVRKNILNEHLCLTDTKNILVFGGDFSMPSPFWLYALDVVITLLERNKGRCILARGRTERFNFWQGFDTVRTYLKRITKKFSSPDIPFSGEIQSFFNVLPDVVRLVHVDTGESIFISHQKIPHELLADPKVCSWIASGPVACYGAKEDGFGFGRFCSGVAQWSLFSAPDFVTSYRMSGYLALPIQKNFSTQIGRYYFGEREHPQQQFKEKRYAATYGFELRTEQDEIRLFNGKTEFVCATADLSGGTGLVGESLVLGVQAVLREANQSGSCAPLLFRHVVFDDQYEPLRARKNVEEMRERYGASYLLAPQGSPTLSAYIDLVKNKQLAVLFSESGGTQFRSPDLQSIVNLRPSFLREVTCLLDYATHTYSLDKLAAVYQDDAFGNPLVDATRGFLQKYSKKTELITIPYVRGQGSFVDQNERLLESNAPAVAYFITSSGPAQSLFGGDMTIFLKGRPVLLVLVDESILRVLQRQGISAIFTSSVPDPEHSQILLVEQYRDAFSQAQQPFSTHSLLGFIAGSLFIDGVNRVLRSGSTVSGSNLVAVFEQYKDVDLSGIMFTFHPEIRSFSLPVWIHHEDNVWKQATCPVGVGQ